MSVLVGQAGLKRGLLEEELHRELEHASLVCPSGVQEPVL